MLKRILFSNLIFLCYLFPNVAIDFYSKFHQKDYKIDFQRLELDSYNKAVFNFVDVKTFKYNRTFPVSNLTMNSKKNMSTGMEVVAQMYKFLSNEYRIMIGSRFQLNMCKAIKANIVGLQIFFKCENFKNCEMVQERTYKICNSYPDESRFPPFLPNGEYRIKVELTNDDVVGMTISMYLKVHRPVVIPKLPK